jgi:hypothetical protein
MGEFRVNATVPAGLSDELDLAWFHRSYCSRLHVTRRTNSSIGIAENALERHIDVTEDETSGSSFHPDPSDSSATSQRCSRWQPSTREQTISWTSRTTTYDH